MQTIDNQSNENFASGSPKNHNHVVIGVLAGGLVLALAGNGYMMSRANHLSEDLAKTEAASQTQIAKLSESTQVMMAQTKQQMDRTAEQMKKDVKVANDSAAYAVRRARTEAQKQAEELKSKLADQEQQQQQVNQQLTQFKDTTDSKFTEVSGNVNNVKTNVEEVKATVATTQSDILKTANDLKRAMGDMGVMSGLIATNSKEVEALRALGERNYFEFDMTKQQGPRKIGDVTLSLKKSDLKRNRFTLDLLADDKRVEKKDKTINEPVQFYVANSRQPYEIVVNQVSKDHVVGYLSTPKVNLARAK